MNRVSRFGGVVGILLIAILVGACGAKSSELAKQDAMNIALELANGRHTGDQAKMKFSQINDIMVKENLKMSEIGRTESELREIVKRSYHADAQTGWSGLQISTHAQPEAAQKLKDEIKRCLREAGETVTDIRTSEADLNRQVARNGLEWAQKYRGGSIAPAEYVAAGLPVPTVYKTRTRTRTVIRRVLVPVKPTPARRPVRSVVKPKARR